MEPVPDELARDGTDGEFTLSSSLTGSRHMLDGIRRFGSYGAPDVGIWFREALWLQSMSDFSTSYSSAPVIEDGS